MKDISTEVGSEISLVERKVKIRLRLEIHQARTNEWRLSNGVKQGNRTGAETEVDHLLRGEDWVKGEKFNWVDITSNQLHHCNRRMWGRLRKRLHQLKYMFALCTFAMVNSCILLRMTGWQIDCNTGVDIKHYGKERGWTVDTHLKL